MVKNSPASAGDTGDVGSIPGLGKFPGVENGNLLQCSCLENSMGGGALQAAVHGVTKSWTRLNTSTKNTLNKELDKRLELDKNL